jgi:hypothetical protein
MSGKAYQALSVSSDVKPSVKKKVLNRKLDVDSAKKRENSRHLAFASVITSFSELAINHTRGCARESICDAEHERKNHNVRTKLP